MLTLLCQMVGYDGPEDWAEMQRVFDVEDAARDYADLCDSRSAGELFTNQDEEQVVRVKDATGTITDVVISFDYSKVFYTRRKEPKK